MTNYDKKQISKCKSRVASQTQMQTKAGLERLGFLQ